MDDRTGSRGAHRAVATPGGSAVGLCRPQRSGTCLCLFSETRCPPKQCRFVLHVAPTALHSTAATGRQVSSTRQKPPTRQDIEGLRAIAVLAVVVNHVTPTLLPGGFTGVDVFFVISGYLIGMHLLEDISVGQFSFLQFYARRARRLLPALVVVLAAVWSFGWLILSPAELASLGKHVAAAALFSNNILLQSESGYFDSASTAKPLLHLWSLGVEEQFYLLVPLLLWLGSRGRHASIAWVARVSAASFLLMELSVTPSFYLLHTRFWELGVGVAAGYLALNAPRLAAGVAVLKVSSCREIAAWALAGIFAAALLLGSSENRFWEVESRLRICGTLVAAAVAILTIQAGSTYRNHNSWIRLSQWLRKHEPRLRNGLGVAGAALIVVTFGYVTPARWPGPQAAIPVLGTVLAILAGPRALANLLLGTRALAFVGGISYPLYLWHWPLIVYCRMLGMTEGTAALVPVGLAAALAWLTKELIEGPARFGSLFGAVVWRPRLGLVVTGLILTGAIGWASLTNGGYPARFPPRLSAIADWAIPYADAEWRVHVCYFYPRETTAFAAECTPPQRAGLPRILLWGDSHAAQLYPGLRQLRKQSDFDLVQWTAAGCPPTLAALSAEEAGCQRRRAWILDQMRTLRPDTVLMAARWDLYLSNGTSQGDILTAVTEDIEWLRSLGVRRIVIFGPGPAWNASLPVDLFRYMSLRRTVVIPQRMGDVPGPVRKLDEKLAEAAVTHQVEYVSVLNWFCNPAGCRTLGNESEHHPDLLFRDQDHLTPSGSRDLMSAAADKILAPLPRS